MVKFTKTFTFLDEKKSYIPYMVKINYWVIHQSRLRHTFLHQKNTIFDCLPSFMRFFLPIVPILSQKLSPSILEFGVFGDLGRGDAIFQQFSIILLLFLVNRPNDTSCISTNDSLISVVTSKLLRFLYCQKRRYTPPPNGV